MPTPPTLPTTLHQTLQTHSGPINALAFSNLGGAYILSGSSDRSIHLCRSTSSSSSSSSGDPSPVTSPIQKYTSHGYAVLSLSISAANTHFASSGLDRAVFHWDIAHAPTSPLRRFAGHTSRVNAVSYYHHPSDGGDSLLISAGDDKTVRLWDLRSRDPRPADVWEHARDGVSCLAVVPRTGGGGAGGGGGTEVLAGSTDGRVRAYDVRAGRVTVDVQPGAVTSLDVTGDGRGVLVGCLDGRLRLMDREGGGCLRAFPGNDDDDNGGQADGYRNESLRLQSCLAANDGLVMSGSEGDGRVRVWDVLSGKLVKSVPVSDSDKVVSVVKWRQGSKAQGTQDIWAAGGADGVVKIYGT